MAKISKPAIPIKMYRHFAVVTVVLTAGLALFADGENRQAIEDHMEERERQAELERASAERFGTPQLVREDEPASRGQFGAENTPSAGGGSSSAQRQFAQLPAGYDPGGTRALPGYSTDYLDSLSDDEYVALVEMLQNAGLLDAAERRRNIAALERRSANRGDEQMGLE